MTTRPFALLLLAPLLLLAAAGSPALAATPSGSPPPGTPARSAPSTPSTPSRAATPVAPRQVRPLSPPPGAKPAFGHDQVDIAAAFFPAGARVTHQEGNVVRTLVVGQDRRSYDVAPPRTLAAAAPAARTPGFWAFAGARVKRAIRADRQRAPRAPAKQ